MLARIGTDRTALELMNEPQFYPCEGSGGVAWEAMLERLVRAARNAAPDLTLVVSGACGGSIKGLQQLSSRWFAQDDLLFSFHFYDPLEFTHQGFHDEWIDIKGAPWPVDDASVQLSLALSVDRLNQQTGLTLAQKTARLAQIRRFFENYKNARWGEVSA